MLIQILVQMAIQDWRAVGPPRCCTTSWMSRLDHALGPVAAPGAKCLDMTRMVAVRGGRKARALARACLHAALMAATSSGGVALLHEHLAYVRACPERLEVSSLSGLLS